MTGIRLEQWDGTKAGNRLEDVMTVYAEAFLDVFEPDPARARRDRTYHVGQHFRREDLVCIAALSAADELVGMTYGVPGRPGTWWHDTVVTGLGPDVADEWMTDVWEIVELHVRPAWQGLGLGRALLRASLDQSSQRTAALSALDDPTLAARHLYAAEGFQALATGFVFPGAPTRYAILAKRLNGGPAT